LTNLGAESNNIKDINEFREKELNLKKRKSVDHIEQLYKEWNNRNK